VIKKFLAAMAAGLLLLAAILGYIGYRTNSELEDTVTELFNRQQLSLARQIAHDIDIHFRFLETSLLSLAAVQHMEPERSREAQLSIFFDLLSEWGVLGVGFMTQDDSRTVAITGEGIVRDSGLRDMLTGCLAWAGRPHEPGAVYIGEDFISRTGPFQGRRILVMATRAGGQGGQGGQDGPNGQAGQAGPETQEGLDFLVLDPMALAQRHAREVRSGETGYSWVINAQGIFLSHFEDNFQGRNAFTVRLERNPDISYSRINELMADKLLKGQEGTEWYISGWHRGVISEMRKLLAYSPIFYAGRDQPERLWSVGLVAPDAEVYGIMQPFLQRQWIVIGISVLLAVSALGGMLSFSLRWAAMLHREVDQKTADLRVERDKVTESMKRLLVAQERLVRSERFAAVGEAAAHLGHEIKNPLLLMGGFAAQVRKRLIGSDPATDPQPDKTREKLCEKLEIIEAEALRLETLLREVSGFTKPNKPKLEEGDITQAVEDTVRLVESDCDERGIQCVVELDHGLPKVFFDPNQLRQVLLNLAKNAVEAMPSGGRITFRTWQDGQMVKISVQDTGGGMPPEVLERLFNPFFTTKTKGTGLGLSVSYRIMEDHGGDIGVTSKVGQGSNFVLTLPVRQDAGA